MYRFQKWREPLQLATDEKTVALVVRDYLDGLKVELVAILPLECREALSQQPLNVPEAAVILMRAELAYQGAPDTRLVLHEITLTLAAASLRIAQLKARDITIPPIKPSDH